MPDVEVRNSDRFEKAKVVKLFYHFPTLKTKGNVGGIVNWETLNS
jgi:hypothetical protein